MSTHIALAPINGMSYGWAVPSVRVAQPMRERHIVD